jgi:hypothetical protein
VIFGLPDPQRIRRAADIARSLGKRRVEQRRAERSLPGLREEELFLTNGSGYRVLVRVVEPDDDRPRAAVVLVPGREQDSRTFVVRPYILSAHEVAAQGARAIAFDPVGRGQSWGHDDFCGSEGQDALRAVLDYVQARRDVLRTRVAIFSFSMGLALAAPVLARDDGRLEVRLLLDWEGPADREAILRTGPLPPAARTALAHDPEGFWRHREPIAAIAEVACPYLRLQAKVDHALGPRGREGALALVAAASRGLSPSAQLNDNPPGRSWRVDQGDDLRWAPSAAAPLNRLLLDVLRERVLD